MHARSAAAGEPGATALPFGLLVFAGSFLLFSIELVMARLLLPGFGSSASVWTTCLVFYQVALLAGYLYAGRASRRIAAGGYRWAHLAFVAVPMAFFPFRIVAPDLPPVAAILLALTLSAGLPFLALSTTSVISQAWFTRSGHRRSHDPYFLYGLSNAGALAALLSYPFVIERSLDLPSQLRLWYAGYALYALLTAWCIRTLPPAVATGTADVAPDMKIAPARRLEWLLLSAGANALLMVVTAVVSMDAPIPLVWILPLTLYLVTLILCFAPKPPSERTIAMLSFGGVAVAAALLFALQAGVRPELSTIALQNTILFVACLMLHDRLIRSKPASASQLGAFYLEISLGGVVGSVLIGLVVPSLFSGTPSHSIDYAIAGSLVLAAFLARDAAGWPARLRERPLRGAAIAAAAAGGIALELLVLGGGNPGDVYGSRTFYGLYRVEDQGGLRRLFHGNTVHGVENLAQERKGEPLAYYHDDSPIGRWLSVERGAPTAGIVGLGVGALAAYRQPGQQWEYYEIDPEVERVARRWFTFLGQDAAESPVLLGDARLVLQKTADARYDVLVMDTFSSDFVPLHLITREAVSLYTGKLKDGGVLFFHISNRLFDLEPILTRIASELGWKASVLRGEVAPEISEQTGRFPSIWFAMTKDDARHARLTGELGWHDRSAVPQSELPSLWTDSYVDLFAAMK
jgi:hypothetical protein